MAARNNLPYLGITFAAVCRFHQIFAEVVAVYNARDTRFVANSSTLAFEEQNIMGYLIWQRH